MSGPPPIEPSTVAEVATLLPDAVERHYGSDRRVDDLRDVCGRFTAARVPLTSTMLAELERAAQTVFRHLELSLGAGLTPRRTSPGWPSPDVAAEIGQGAGIAAVRRTSDGRAVIRLTGLASVRAAAPLLVAAFELVRGAGRVVIDLRENGGGDPATLVLIVDWLAGGAPRHLFDVRYRDRVREWWSPGSCPVAPPTGDVQAWIGPATYSSGEALAWVLQQQGLARLVGEPTAGAADHVVPLALTHDVSALVPEACVRAPGGGPTWEGGGVQPDEPPENTDFTGLG